MAFRRVALLRFLLFVVALTALSFLALSALKDVIYDEKGAAMRLRVASVAMSCDIAPAVNRQRILDRVSVIKREHPEVDLVLFGETITGWYSKGAESNRYHRSIAETIPGHTTAVMSAAARERHVYLSFGMSEASDGKMYNAQVLIDPAGSIIAVHRKVNLEGSKIFDPGVVPATMVEIKGIRTAIIICSDIQSATVRQAIMSQEPELVLGSLASPKDPGWFVSGLIAKILGGWILTANRYGDEGGRFYDGQMILSDPLGELRLKVKDREQYIYSDIGFDRGRSPVRRVLRTVYRWESLGLHLIKNVTMVLPSSRT